MAEIEFSILGRKYLERRIPDKTALINEVYAWTEERNSKKSKITELWPLFNRRQIVYGKCIHLSVSQNFFNQAASIFTFLRCRY